MPPAIPPGPTRRALLSGLLGSSVVAAGCGHSSAGSVADTFTVAMQGAGAAEGIDPGVNTLFIDEARMKAVFDGLFEIDGTMAPIPRLATSAEPNIDGTRWRVGLRDARWHDGKKLTADDVLYTLARILGPEQRRPFVGASALNRIDLAQCRAMNDHTVEIVTKQPTFELPLLLSGYGTKIVQHGAKDFAHPVGTGPFVIESFRPGRQFDATANEHYWDGAPGIRRLRIVGAESDARTTAVRSGEVDFADNLPPTAARSLAGRRGVSLESTPNCGTYFFAMKTDRPPFHLPDVRRAVMRMVDRAELVKVALQGQGDVADDVFGKGYRYYADLPQHEYDPDEVRRLLAKAGVRNLSFDLFTAQVGNGFIEAARLFAEHAAHCGVRVAVVIGSKDSYYADSLHTGHLTMGEFGPSPIPSHFASRLVTGAPQNRTKWSDPEFDALYTRAQSTPTPEGRTVIYRTMHEILHDRGGFVFFGNTVWNRAVSDRFRDVPAAIPNSHDWARFDKVTIR